jgi:Concanavalin A-like lectin/glucanases superfamily/Immunoglobulin I-set domain
MPRTNNAIAEGGALTELAGTINSANAVTMEAWFIQNAENNWSKIMMTGTDTNTYMDITPRRGDGTDGTSCSINDTAHGENNVNNESALTTGTEYYLAAIWDEGSNSMSIVVIPVGNPAGAIVETATMGGQDLAAVSINQFYLGSAVGFGDSDFQGQIKEFRIYNHALGAAEIEANYDSGTEAMAAMLVGPGNGVNINAVSTTLEWQPAPILPGTLTNYDIYLAKEGEALAKLDTVSAATTTYPTGILDINSTYNWRIDQVTIDDPCTVTGAVWSFDTLQTVASLTGPVDTRVKPNENAELVVAIDSDTTVTDWQWKMVGDPDDIDLIAGAKYDISTSQTETTLTVKNVDVTDVGQYYCVVTNGAGPNDSAVANLGLNLTVAHYEFETDPVPDPNVPDSSGADNDGFAYGVPALVAGLVGSGAYDFDGADNVEIPTVVRDDFTIMAWVNTTQTISGTGDGWWNGGGIVNGEMPGGIDDFGMQLLGSKACVAVQNVQIVSDTDINDGAWHHVAFTRNSATGQIRVYVDGRMEAQATSITGTLTAPTNLQIGKQQTGDGYFIGLIDDVIINDYVMEPLEIADQVYIVTQEPVCTGDVEFDFNNDCQVDLKDFALFAERWLDCKFYPQCFE